MKGKKRIGDVAILNGKQVMILEISKDIAYVSYVNQMNRLTHCRVDDLK